jgi:hypothetical protein
MSTDTDLKLLELIQNNNKTIEGLVKTNLELIPIIQDLARRVRELEAKQPTASDLTSPYTNGVRRTRKQMQ